MREYLNFVDFNEIARANCDKHDHANDGQLRRRYLFFIARLQIN